MGANLVFEDESGFCLVSALKRTWARRRQTPIFKSTLSHHQRINIIGAILVSPKGRRLRLQTHCYRHSITGKQIMAFLRALLHRIAGPIVWVWDNHPTHCRKVVQSFIDRHNRLHVFHLPRYAPELNPAEGIWTQLCEWTAGTTPHSIAPLSSNLHAALSRTRQSQRRLPACLLASKLPAAQNLLRS